MYTRILLLQYDILDQRTKEINKKTLKFFIFVCFIDFLFLFIFCKNYNAAFFATFFFCSSDFDGFCVKTDSVQTKIEEPPYDDSNNENNNYNNNSSGGSSNDEHNYIHSNITKKKIQKKNGNKKKQTTKATVNAIFGYIVQQQHIQKQIPNNNAAK